MTNFQEVDVPQGAYVGWGQIGQTITMRVRTFDPEGGTDFNEQKCPLLTGELTEDADNYKDKGTRKETIAAGEMVMVTCAQANLKRTVLAANPGPGDLFRLRYEEDYKTAKGTGKAFRAGIARAELTPVEPVDDAFFGDTAS